MREKYSEIQLKTLRFWILPNKSLSPFSEMSVYVVIQTESKMYVTQCQTLLRISKVSAYGNDQYTCQFEIEDSEMLINLESQNQKANIELWSYDEYELLGQFYLWKILNQHIQDICITSRGNQAKLEIISKPYLTPQDTLDTIDTKHTNKHTGVIGRACQKIRTGSCERTKQTSGNLALQNNQKINAGNKLRENARASNRHQFGLGDRMGSASGRVGSVPIWKKHEEKDDTLEMILSPHKDREIGSPRWDGLRKVISPRISLAKETKTRLFTMTPPSIPSTQFDPTLFQNNLERKTKIMRKLRL